MEIEGDEGDDGGEKQCRTADDIRIADCTVAAGGDGCQPWRILQVKVLVVTVELVE
ncbi:hypothetical protein OsI_35176 [Oryza sativa Indica Group]|uniref:Uncharacterized protein n=1 Tax=Oryza sativa subsp. indica TaxID=39946 RepID=A2ZBM3_ORYSI|nr:hypothetical protein OsI_35176 [Oryza sativa Indica Group]